MKNILLLMTLLLLLFSSCEKEESTTSTIIHKEDVIETQTEVRITVLNTQEEPQSNYVVMMFEEEIDENEPLPPILKQVITDESGLASFDLGNMVSENETKIYYFEAFTEIPNGYVYESLFHTKLEVKKGSRVSTSIVVN